MAAAPAIIKNFFGQLTGWCNMRLQMLGRQVVGITEVSYKDKMKMENAYGAGNFPVGQTKGNYEPEASITLLFEEHRAILASLPSGKFVYDITPFDITVKYFHDNVEYTDVLRNCRFMEQGVEVKQGDGSIAMKMPILISHIEYNV